MYSYVLIAQLRLSITDLVKCGKWTLWVTALSWHSEWDVCILTRSQTLRRGPCSDKYPTGLSASSFSKRTQAKRHGSITSCNGRRTSAALLLLISSKRLSFPTSQRLYQLSERAKSDWWRIFSLSLQQIRGDNVAACTPNDGFVSMRLKKTKKTKNANKRYFCAFHPHTSLTN